ncbi:MAG: phage holin family protein [Pseudomonadota bacterium]
MLDQDNTASDAASGTEAAARAGVDAHEGASPPFDESLVEEVSALIDNAKTYAEAEVAFQKTRAALTGANVGAALGFVIVALILLHIAIIALAVGFVIALAPLVTIWGAIAIVVGVLLAGTGGLIWAAVNRGKQIAEMFASKDNDKVAEDAEEAQ